VKKIWLVALHEYRRHVLTRRFAFGLLSVPLVALAMVALILFVISLQSDSSPIGYVDHSSLLANPVFPPKPSFPDKAIPLIRYDTEADAQAALDKGILQSYYVLPADYTASGSIQVFHIKAVKDSSRQYFYSFLGVNLLRNTDPAVANRLLEGADVTIRSADGRRSLSGNDWFSFLIPMVAGIGFIIAMFTSGGYLMQAVVEEKENRTMEVVITSVTPNQLMAGKILGDTAIGLTQILLWILFIVIPILFAQRSIEFLRAIQVSGQTVVVMLLVMLPSFVLVAGLMAMIGATVSEAQEGQQMTGIIAFPIWIPYMLTMIFMGSPNSVVSVVFSMVPMMAPVTMLMRDGLTILPFWQIALSSAIQISAAVFVIWLAGKAFRVGMLRYGQKLKLREIFAKGQ
jgi:ABC-2 type transport system permease protein